MSIKCWAPDHCVEEVDATEYNPKNGLDRVLSLEQAVRTYAKKRFHDDDYPMHQEIYAREDDGEVEIFDVNVEMEPSFFVSRRR